jgi:uncharacterized protein (TIGR02598 family)
MTITLPLRVFRRRVAAFTLSEVALSIGILAFALTPILGLLPTGLRLFRDATQTAVQAQIVQRITAEAAQTEFSKLTSSGVREFAPRYFDDQGTEVETAGSALYHVKLVATTPAALPGGSSSDLARLTIDIVSNPGNKPLATDPATRGFLEDAANGVTVSRHQALVARSR